MWTSGDEKKPGTESKAVSKARHLMGTTFISKLMATPSSKEASSRTAVSSHTGPQGRLTPQRLSAPAFCVQDMGPNMGPSTNKQTNKQGKTISGNGFIALKVFWASLLVPRRARHEVGLPAVEADLREAALGGKPAADAPGVVGKAPGAAAVVARQATGFHVQVGDTLAEATNI